MTGGARVEEEKKEEGCQSSSPPSPVTTSIDVDHHRASESDDGGPKPLMLLICATGITSCYLWYGTLQERLFHHNTHGGGGGGGGQSVTLFLLSTSTASSFLLALVWSSLPSSKETNAGARATAKEQRLDHALLFLTSVCYVAAMAASNEALNYVSYPTAVLAKSSKLIPTMVVGALVEWIGHLRRQRRKAVGDDEGADGMAHGANSYSTAEWIGTGLITAGIVSFNLANAKQSKGGGDESEDSPIGLALLGFSLVMDGFLGACQTAIKKKKSTAIRPPSAIELMLHINLWATLLLVPLAYRAGQIGAGISLLNSSSSTLYAIAGMNLSAAMGQVFIFLTIHHFSPLTCTTITTTRKFFTILLSVRNFGHAFGWKRWRGVALVFVGLYLEIVAKVWKRRGGGVTSKLKKA